MPEREVVQTGGGDLVVREEHVVGLDHAGHAERAMDDPDPPAGAPILAAGEAGQRAGSHTLGGSTRPKTIRSRVEKTTSGRSGVRTTIISLRWLQAGHGGQVVMR